MDFSLEPELCPRVPCIGDVWLSPDLREFVEVLRPVKAIPGMYVIRTIETRLPGIDLFPLPRFASPSKERYTYIGHKDDIASRQFAADMFETGHRLDAGDIVVDMNGQHGIVCNGGKLIKWVIPSEDASIYDLSAPSASKWPISFICKTANSDNKFHVGLQQLGYMFHHDRLWRT